MWPFSRGRAQRDFEEEVRSHLDLETEDLIAEGVPASAAQLVARKRFGNVTQSQERFYHARRWAWLADLVQDIRYGTRFLRNTPGFALIAIVTIALGIGANTAVFSVIRGVLLEPLPYREPSRLVLLWETLSGGDIVVSYPDYLDWRARTRSFDGLAVYNPYASMSLLAGDVPEHVSTGYATATLFPVLGLSPILGRVFSADEDRPNVGRTALLTEGWWRTRFGADPHVIGRRLTLDGDEYTVIGVIPAAPGLGKLDLWVPLGLFAIGDAYNRANHPGLLGIGRLKPGMTLAQVNEDLERVSAQIREEYPNDAAGIGAQGLFLTEHLVKRVRPTLKVLSWAVGLVLLLACVNVANLLLGRSTGRSKEVALRTALGARRSRIVRQLLVESLLLSLVGGSLGVAFAYAAVRTVVQLNPGGVPRLDTISVDGTVLAFAALVAVATGLLFGLIPASSAARVDVNGTLKETARSTATAASVRLRSILMIFEVAIAMVLLAAAGLLVRSFMHLRGVDPGVEARQVAIAWINLPEKKYGTEASQRQAMFDILRRVQAVPGVRGAALSSALPLGANTQFGVSFEGHPQPARTRPLVNVNLVTADYFATMRMRVLEGRGVQPSDGPGSPLVAVISQSLARQYFPGENPIGRHILRGGSDSKDPPWTVVGIVNDVSETSLDAKPVGVMYLPFPQNPMSWMALSVRSPLPATALLPALRHAVAEFDRGVPLANASPLEDMIGKSIGRQRFTMFTLGIFAAVALLLAAVGVYGVISFYVTQRSHELGIRMALGAARRDIAVLIGRRVLLTTGVGIGVGMIASALAGGLLSKLLFDVRPFDVPTYAWGAATLVVAAATAAYVPARRATRVDPVRTIRSN